MASLSLHAQARPARALSLVRTTFALSLVGATLALVAGCGGTDDLLFFGSGGAGGEAEGVSSGQGGASPITTCAVAADCAALDSACAKGSCIAGTCVASPANEFGLCEDGLFCTDNDVCQGGACVAGPPRACPSPDPCHAGTCDEAARACEATAAADGASCDDLDACTGFGVCATGACQKGAPVDCSGSGGECAVGACDPLVGCISAPANDGVACDDASGDPCLMGECSAGACVPVPNDGAACDDGLYCTAGDACQGGACHAGAASPCADPGGCLAGTCDEASHACGTAPGHEGAACDDLDGCTTGTTCVAGACAGGVPAPDGQACSDETACTTGDACKAGVCAGTGPTVYFADDFGGALHGWTLGTEWQIGSAAVSSDGAWGADPAADHTPTADNGVAGVVLGGNAEQAVHDYRYLESPPFDTASADTVQLTFYRWLNSDFDPYMHDVIQVWNGSAWIQLWKSGDKEIVDSPPTGAGWTMIVHDLGAYKNAAMRVRFGFDIGDGQVYAVGSWNIDDVTVASAVCP